MTVFAKADATRACAVLSAISILMSSGLAMTPRFSPRDMARQVRSSRSSPRILDAPNSGLDSGAFLIDTSVTLAPAPRSQSEPSIAFDGGNYLVVWEDNRNGSDIYGTRVTQQGTVLDSTGFVISKAAGSRYSPVVSFDGANFLVAWRDSRVGAWDIYGARVAPQGTVLDTSGFVISQASGNQYSPALGFDGANFLVVWIDERLSDSYIYGARVTPQGAVIDSSGFAISEAPDCQDPPSVGFDGANFLVVWQDGIDGGSDIYGARVTPRGSVLDSTGIVISQAAGDQNNPAVGSNGANLLVVWEDLRSDDYSDIYGARVTPQGAVLDPAGIVISQADDDQCDPAMDYDGAQFLVVWEDDRDGHDIYGARVTPQGTVLDSAGFVVSQAGNNQYFPAVGFDGTNFLVVWQDYRDPYGDIYGARVTPQGTVLDSTGILVAEAANSECSPALAYDGTNFLVVWQDNRGDSAWDIYGARVASEATVLDPSGFVISQAAGNQCTPAVGFDGENFLVAWEDTRSTSPFISIYGARVTPQGAVLDPSGIAIAQAFGDRYSPAIGSDGTNFLVVWQDYRDPYGDIYGARVTPHGTVLDPAGIVISHAADEQRSPAIGFDGADFLVAWRDLRSGLFSDIYAARVTPQGTVLDSAGIAITQVAGHQGYPAVAFDGANSLVAWEDDRSSSRADIYGARVTPQGTVLDQSGLVISQAANGQYYPAVAFDGATYLAVWEDHRSGSDIYGARVTPAGVVFDSGPIVRQEGNQAVPALARGAGNCIFLVYQGWTGAVGGKDYSTYRTWGLMDPNPAIAEMTKPEARRTNNGTTIVRGVLYLPMASNLKPRIVGLLDISGRKVRDLHPGANDVRGLAPGVYFVREAQAQAVRKVVLTE